MSQNIGAEPDNFSDVPSQKKSAGCWITGFVVLGCGVLLIGFLLPAVRSARPAAYRAQCSNNLKRIARALHDYESVYHALPPAYTVDADGKPLHSWRTLILPYLEQKQLYDTIDLSKAWDDPANAAACNAKLSVFHCPSATCPEDHTTYLAIVAPNGCFRRTEPRQLAEITDGPSETLMLIEVSPEQSVLWMSPVDADEALVLGLGPESKLAHQGGMNTAYCDGDVKFLRADVPAEVRRALISIAGNDRLSAIIDD